MRWIGRSRWVECAEALVRGGAWLSYVRDGTLLLGALNPADPLPRGAVLSLGLVARPRRQIDFAMVASIGFGDVAPFALTLRGPLDFSMGKGYSYPQSLVVDILRETGQWIAEQLRKLPEPMQQTCVLYGRDGLPIATLGTLTADGEHCEFQGQRFGLGDKLYPDPAQRRVCLDPQATHCVAAAQAAGSNSPIGAPGPVPNPLSSTLPDAALSPGGKPAATPLSPAMLQHLLNQGALGPIRGQLDDQCILNEGNQQVSPIGHRSSDGKHCIIDRDVVNKKTGQKVRTEKLQIPVGQSVYRDPATGRVCLKANAKGHKDCPVELDPEHNRPMTPGERAGYHGAIGLTNKADQYTNSVKKGGELLTDPVKLSTAALEAEERAEQAAKSAVETLKDPNRAKDAAREAWNSTVDTAQGAWKAAKGWWNKPPEQKIDDIAESGGGAILSVPVDAAAGAAIGGVLRTGDAALEVGEDIRNTTKSAKRIEETADHAKSSVENQVRNHVPPHGVTGPAEPYNRRKHYGDTPTAQDRRTIGGESVDHEPPLVRRYYEGDPAKGELPGYQMTQEQRRASAVDRSRMRPATTDEQRRQGGQMSGYSKGKKQEHGL